jgi:predicted ATPase/2-polyprenyl-3-methyl-5-hydroxy-6-metoxy-1,4-benzoquinol methylase
VQGGEAPLGICSIELSKDTYQSLDIGPCELPLDEPLHMPSLGKVVLLAGPNGAGKSRLLRLIPKLMEKHLVGDKRTPEEKKLSDLGLDIQTWQARITELNGKPGDDVAIQMANARANLADVQAKMASISARLSMTSLVALDVSQAPVVVDFVPKVPGLVSPADVSDTEAKGRAVQMRNLGVAEAEKAAPAYLRNVMRAAYRAIGRQDEKAREAQLEKNNLLTLIGSLLGTNVVPDLNDDFNLAVDGVPLTARGLSPGQQVLFQFACMLHAQGANLENCLVLMDEPENHLHPQVMITVIDQIISKLGAGGQVWIASHSVPLVAHLASSDPACLWLVKDETVKPAKRAPDSVLYSLMGGEDGAQSLKNFLRLPDEYAALRFLAQCLEPPGVVGADIKDPQTNQIAAIVKSRRDSQARPIRILDYGAGKGRLLSTLAAGDDAKSWLDYIAFDIDTEHTAARLKELQAVYGEGGAQRNIAEVDLEAWRIDRGSVDIVVLCNVLHEIDPDEWQRYFGTDGRISKLLKDDGFLLLVEDYKIPVGERAHRYGFLLLDEAELVHLYAVSESDRSAKLFIRETPTLDRYKDRLVAYLIQKSCLNRMTAQTRREAIAELERRMKGQIRSTLAEAREVRDAESGLAYARAAQLFANATIWLEDHQ